LNDDPHYWAKVITEAALESRAAEFNSDEPCARTPPGRGVDARLADCVQLLQTGEAKFGYGNHQDTKDSKEEQGETNAPSDCFLFEVFETSCWIPHEGEDDEFTNGCINE
jgi:hypothetical protein